MEWRVHIDPPVTGWSSIAPNMSLPDYFTAEGVIDGYRIKMSLQVDMGVVECSHLTVTAPDVLEVGAGRREGDGRWSTRVTGDVLRRIPVDYLVKESVKLALIEAERLVLGHDVDPTGMIPAEILGEWPNGDVDRALERIAVCYQRAAAVGDPPNVAVQRATGWSRATASRAIKMARERGLLTDDEQGWGKYGGPRPKISLIGPGESDAERIQVDG